MEEDYLLVICVDCEEQWALDYEPDQCICDDPADDAWILFMKDAKGHWVRSMMKELKIRHGE